MDETVEQPDTRIMNETEKQPETINISKLDKAEVLAALYNASRPLGMGFLHFDPKPMTREEAQAEIDAALADEHNRRKELYFDYLKGRVMKVDLTGDEFHPWLFDRDNGDGAAARALEQLAARQKGAA